MEHMKVSTKKWKMGYFENVKRREPFLDIDYEELESCTSIPKSSFSKKKKKKKKSTYAVHQYWEKVSKIFHTFCLYL